MANIPVRDANNQIVYLEATGTGTSGDPFKPVQDMEATTLPLPTGAATSARQDTQTTHLSNIATGVNVNSGSSHIGQIGGESTVLSVTFSCSAGSYATGEVIADTQEIASTLRVAGKPVKLVSLTLLDKDYQGEDADVVFLNSNVSLGSEGGAISISDTDAEKILGVVSIASSEYKDFVNSKIASKLEKDLGLILNPASGTSIWAAVVSRGTGVYTASGLVMKIGVERD